MTDTKELLQRAQRRFPSPEGVMESLVRRRERKRRNRRISAAVVALIVAAVSFAGLARAFFDTERPADAPETKDIFANIHGWIVYGNGAGIWAVDPENPDDPADQIQLSTRAAEPVAWSSDGTRLLIRRVGPEKRPRVGLFVLNADGTETRLTHDGWDTGGSFSPDGSSVVYAPAVFGPATRIYVVDVDGGTRRVLLTAGRRTELYMPTFSPDGTKIAYFDGAFDHSHSLRVMNADGSDPQVLVDEVPQEAGHIFHLVWSPDGGRLAFDFRGVGIYVVNADGSGLRLAIPGGFNPHWSPDGSQISYAYGPEGPRLTGGLLAIAAPDGTHIREFGYGASGPWHPLARSAPVDGEAATIAGGASRVVFVSTIVGLGITALIVLVRRARRQRHVPTQI